MDICDMIADKKRAEIKAEEDKRRELAEKGERIVDELRDKLPKLREAHRIFKALQINGYLMKGEDMYLNREQHYKRGYFISDGWYHWPGFDDKANVFFTMGGGFNRFSCGIALDNFNVVVSEKEFGTPATVIPVELMKKMCEDGGSWSTKHTEPGHYYDMTGSEIVSKLEYCNAVADTFCEKVMEFAENLVKDKEVSK